MSIDQFDDVKPGEIMVCQMTNPAWTPLFAVIAGIVTDAGGVVSHPAVMAREFGIPAVIGCSIATLKIKTGDKIRVDGTKGLVEVL
jgi:pyruvate,water dikinase